jgi:putative SOS response-associated peptidase YedK
MCNEARRNIALGKLREDWGQTRIPLVFPEGAPNMAPLERIRITDPATIIRATADASTGLPEPPEGIPSLGSIEVKDREGLRQAQPGRGWDAPLVAELVTRRWSWPGAHGKPVYNFRSDGREFRSGRCLVPVDSFFEFTAPADPQQKRKDKWLFTLAGHDWFCIAGLWRSDPAVGEAFTMLTCPPGPDTAPYHNRQMVVLGRDAWAAWLNPQTPAAELCRPLPAGSLHVRPA